MPGPTGPAVGSKTAQDVRQAAITQIDDPGRKQRAGQNDVLLERLGKVTLELEVGAMDKWTALKYHYLYATPSPTNRLGYCRTPTRWPHFLGIPSARQGSSGPAGSRGMVPPDASLHLAEEEHIDIGSEQLTAKLRLLEQRLEVINDVP